MKRFEEEDAEALVLALAAHCVYSPGHKASLKRNQGNALDEARNIDWFRHFLARWRDEIQLESVPSDGLIFLLATLLASDRSALKEFLNIEELPIGKRNLGAALDDVEKKQDAEAHKKKMKIPPDPQRRESRFERRLRVLLDAELVWDGSGELTFRLRQCVHLVLAQRDNVARINWGKLLYDLWRWNWNSRPTRREWAQSFYNDPRVAAKSVVIPEIPTLESDIAV